MADLYAKAEAALLEGDEEAARGFLASRAAAKRALESLVDGQRKREVDRRKELEEKVDELYAKAEEALKAGDEEAARGFLAKREEAKAGISFHSVPFERDRPHPKRTPRNEARCPRGIGNARGDRQRGAPVRSVEERPARGSRGRFRSAAGAGRLGVSLTKENPIRVEQTNTQANK